MCSRFWLGLGHKQDGSSFYLWIICILVQTLSKYYSNVFIVFLLHSDELYLSTGIILQYIPFIEIHSIVTS